MIPNGEGWHYLPVKNILALLRRITSKHHGIFYCLNYFHSFTKENRLESYKNECESKCFCNVLISFKCTKILEFNQYQKSDKAPFVVYADLNRKEQ